MGGKYVKETKMLACVPRILWTLAFQRKNLKREAGGWDSESGGQGKKLPTASTAWSRTSCLSGYSPDFRTVSVTFDAFNWFFHRPRMKWSTHNSWFRLRCLPAKNKAAAPRQFWSPPFIFPHDCALVTCSAGSPAIFFFNPLSDLGSEGTTLKAQYWNYINCRPAQSRAVGLDY